jgi:DeoR family transcriptional regulator, ulaG and ulaABCDEF operon transcriptional repressor
MHSSEREDIILGLIAAKGFVSFRELEGKINGSPATIRRDLERLAGEDKLVRVRGGAKSAGETEAKALAPNLHLAGVPFHENISLNRAAKESIGKVRQRLLCVSRAKV